MDTLPNLIPQQPYKVDIKIVLKEETEAQKKAYPKSLRK